MTGPFGLIDRLQVRLRRRGYRVQVSLSPTLCLYTVMVYRRRGTGIAVHSQAYSAEFLLDHENDEFVASIMEYEALASFRRLYAQRRPGVNFFRRRRHRRMAGK